MKGTGYAELRLFADTNVYIKAMIEQNSFEIQLKHISSICVLLYFKYK